MGVGQSLSGIYRGGWKVMVLIQVQSSLWRVLSGEDIIQFAFLKDHSVHSVENGLEMEKRMEEGITAQRPL